MTKTTIHQKYGRDAQKRSEKLGRNYDREGLCASNFRIRINLGQTDITAYAGEMYAFLMKNATITTTEIIRGTRDAADAHSALKLSVREVL